MPIFLEVLLCLVLLVAVVGIGSLLSAAIVEMWIEIERLLRQRRNDKEDDDG